MTEQAIESDPQSREQYWEKQIERWESSKLTQAEFCRRNGFKSSKFLYWKSKLRKTPKSNISFVQLPVHPPNETMLGQSNASQGLRLFIRNRFQVEIGPGFDPGTLQKLIYTLERL
jgi:hypothetical protein